MSARRSRHSLGSPSDAGSYKLVPSRDIPNFSAHQGTAERTSSLAEDVEDVQDEVCGTELLEHPVVQTCTIALIVSNAVVIGFETDMPHLFKWNVVENIFLLLFTCELLMRMSIIGAVKYFKPSNNPDVLWNSFDFIVVCFGIFNLLLSLSTVSAQNVGRDATLFRIIRLLRILRVLRIIRIVRFLKQLYLLAYGFLEGAMAVFWVTLLTSFMLYICAVMLVRTYGRTSSKSPDYEFFQEHFGNIPKTMFSLFELISAPNLGPYRKTMFENLPLVIFLVAFIILGSFGINGLLVALINESILEKNQARIEAERIERESKRKTMQQRCRDLFDANDVHNQRVLPRSELMKCTSQIAALFESLGVNFQRSDLDQMFYIMDYNDTGTIERSEFVQGVVELCDQIRPMSIMELHYQVSKCASKVEQSDLKVDSIVKTVENLDIKMSQLAETVEQAANSCNSTVYGFDDNGLPSGVSAAPGIDEQHAGAWAMNTRFSRSGSLRPPKLDGNAVLQEMLAEHRSRLAEVHMRILEFLKPGPDAEFWEKPEEALESLLQTILDLQCANAELLELILDG